MKRILVILVVLTTGLLQAGAPGSSSSNTWLITTGSSGLAGNLVRDTDTHWYRFLASPAMVYTVHVDNVTLWDHDLALRIFADGEDVTFANSATHPQPSSSVVWTNTGGLRFYYVEVSAFLQFTTGTYNLAVTANDTDTDGDGIPDAWETLHFGGPTNAVAAATTVSGVTTWEAFATGTDPNDPDGALMVHINLDGDTIAVSWNTVPYAAYHVESSADIRHGAGWVFRNRYVTGPLAEALHHVDMTGFKMQHVYRIVHDAN